MSVKWLALVIGAIGVAAFVTCTPLEGGKPCATHDRCALHEYCEPQLGQCVRWTYQDPSCTSPACDEEQQYCSHGSCRPRFSAITITSPAPDAVEDRYINASAVVTPAVDAPDSGAFIPYHLTFTITHDDGGLIGRTRFPMPALQINASLSPVSLDASVVLTAALDDGGLTSAPVRIFIDQTL